MTDRFRFVDPPVNWEIEREADELRPEVKDLIMRYARGLKEPDEMAPGARSAGIRPDRRSILKVKGPWGFLTNGHTSGLIAPQDENYPSIPHFFDYQNGILRENADLPEPFMGLRPESAHQEWAGIECVSTIGMTAGTPLLILRGHTGNRELAAIAVYYPTPHMKRAADWLKIPTAGFERIHRATAKQAGHELARIHGETNMYNAQHHLGNYTYNIQTDRFIHFDLESLRPHAANTNQEQRNNLELNDLMRAIDSYLGNSRPDLAHELTKAYFQKKLGTTPELDWNQIGRKLPVELMIVQMALDELREQINVDGICRFVMMHRILELFQTQHEAIGCSSNLAQQYLASTADQTTLLLSQSLIEILNSSINQFDKMSIIHNLFTTLS